VPAADEGAAVEAVDFDFGFAFVESESLEHAVSRAPVTSRAMNGVLRRTRCI
jgi:hypothetical protein